MSGNPFDDPWRQAPDGPAFGNAYESNDRQQQPWNGYAMPAPPPSHSQEGHAWRESNKTQAEHPRPLANQDAYQYTGTRYGNQDFAATSNAFSTQHQDTAPTHTQPTSQPVDTASVHTDTRRTGRPSRLRLLLRTILFVASVGHLGFAAGASPYSNQPVPFDNRSCFYYLFAVAVLSILWTGFHIIHFFLRWVTHSQKIRRPILFGIDALFVLLWGIGIIIEISRYHCAPGDHNHWCDFYNVSIFWGFLCFVGYIVALVWGIFGACRGKRR